MAARRRGKRPLLVDLSNVDPSQVRARVVRKGKRKAIEVGMDDEFGHPTKRTRYNLRSTRNSVAGELKKPMKTTKMQVTSTVLLDSDSEESPDASESGAGGKVDAVTIDLDAIAMDGPITRSRARLLKERLRARSKVDAKRRAKRSAAQLSEDGSDDFDDENVDSFVSDDYFMEDSEDTSEPFERTLTLEKWDENDESDELASVYYAPDITRALFAHENAEYLQPPMDYMANQRDLSKRMRTILLDWLLDVHRKFELLTPTLYLGVSLLDRYLGHDNVQVRKERLQLTGCACLWVASKYHEIFAPEMYDFIYISDDAFTNEQLVAAETEIVAALEFNITVPSMLTFAQRFLKVLFGVPNGGVVGRSPRDREKAVKAVENLCHYIMEHALMDYSIATRYRRSLVAASALCYATMCMKFEKRWPLRLQQVTGYKMVQLRPVLQILDCILKREVKRCRHKAVRKKYSHKKFGQISLYDYDNVRISVWRDEISTTEAAP